MQFYIELYSQDISSSNYIHYQDKQGGIYDEYFNCLT